MVLGLVVGKTVGIFGGTWLTARFTRAQLNEDLAWADVFAVATLAGIGFTVSLLIGELAFAGDADMINEVKAAVLIGSLIAAVLSGVLLKTADTQYRALYEDEERDEDERRPRRLRAGRPRVPPAHGRDPREEGRRAPSPRAGRRRAPRACRSAGRGQARRTDVRHDLTRRYKTRRHKSRGRHAMSAPDGNAGQRRSQSRPAVRLGDRRDVRAGARRDRAGQGGDAARTSSAARSAAGLSSVAGVVLLFSLPMLSFARPTASTTWSPGLAWSLPASSRPSCCWPACSP